jgi:hypothetical protein
LGIGGDYMPRGRPTAYKKEYNEQAYKLCLLGATDKEMADFFGVSEVTFNAWKKNHPEFLKSLKKGKEIADANVASRLYERAMGYSHPEEKIFNDNGKPKKTDLQRKERAETDGQRLMYTVTPTKVGTFIQSLKLANNDTLISHPDEL